MSLSILGVSSSNVGQILGDNAKGVIRNIAIFGGKFTSADTADVASIQAALAAASLKAKTDTGKLYWLPEVQNFESKKEQNTTGALNLGPTVMLKEGKQGYEIRVDGTSEFCKAMRRWNNKTIGVLEYDSNRQLWGRAVGTDYYGYTCKVYVDAMGVASGQAPEEGIVTITLSFLSATEYGDQGKCIDLSEVDTSLIKTQVDASFQETAAHVSNVYTMKWQIPLGKINSFYDVLAKYTSEINTLGAAGFEAFTGANYGTVMDITTVAIVAGVLNVTFDTADFAALSAGAKIKFNSKAPSVLEAADIFDIEGAYIILTK